MTKKGSKENNSLGKCFIRSMKKKNDSTGDLLCFMVKFDDMTKKNIIRIDDERRPLDRRLTSSF